MVEAMDMDGNIVALDPLPNEEGTIYLGRKFDPLTSRAWRLAVSVTEQERASLLADEASIWALHRTTCQFGRHPAFHGRSMT
ncbi:hypothetical protein WG936_08120 [Corynebacterium sp. H127]|uniref:hypothetical protein n=1 Tax=Corynebacterium sp. H127 TaxID=3133418 RepID=UPI0030B7B4BF